MTKVCTIIIIINVGLILIIFVIIIKIGLGIEQDENLNVPALSDVVGCLSLDWRFLQQSQKIPRIPIKPCSKQHSRSNNLTHLHSLTLSFHSSLPHLLRGEVLPGPGEELGEERLHRPHHGAEAVDAEQHGGAHPSCMAAAGGGHVRPAAAAATPLPAPAKKTHRSSVGLPGGRSRV